MNVGPLFRVVPLDGTHDREPFNSGSKPLEHYFKNQVTQNIRRWVTACFVSLTASQRLAGFYTLASSSVLLSTLPPSQGKKLPRYPLVPAVRLGRLAVDQIFKGQGLGGALLADALVRSVRAEIAAYAMVVDAKDESAAAFDRHHGFIALPDQPLLLFLPLATVQNLKSE